MKVLKITCRGGQKFYCEDYKQLGTFVKNYPLPDIRVEEVEMLREEYNAIPATEESAKYFRESA